MTDEQRELMRQCAQRVLDNHAAGRVVDPHSLEWARGIVAYVKPRSLPLSMGEAAGHEEDRSAIAGGVSA